ncbi:MAG: hypothetical protein RIB03_01620 [Henriciella sp.]|uniref:hypothetical protein n=1 Tax=Henriciella sp. TaxID=1968823 RepID=UPI002614A601|nr:hypothetical protein [Henriciella sp.]
MVLGFWLLMFVLNLVAFWRIFQKAGFKGAYALMMVVPILNVVGLLLLAFVEWPVHRLVDYLDEERRR